MGTSALSTRLLLHSSLFAVIVLSSNARAGLSADPTAAAEAAVQSSSVAATSAFKGSCRRFFFNGAVNNLKFWTLPLDCEAYAAEYAQGVVDGYAADVQEAALDAVDYFQGLTSHPLKQYFLYHEQQQHQQQGQQQKQQQQQADVVLESEAGSSERRHGISVVKQTTTAGGRKELLSTSTSRMDSSGSGGNDDSGISWASEVEVGRPKSPSLPAVVFDIDETLLSNLPYLAQHNYGAESFSQDTWDPWVLLAAAPALNGTRALLLALAQADFAVFLVTGRQEWQRNATLLNLRRAGMGSGWTALYMRPPSSGPRMLLPLQQQGLQLRESALVYKSRCRKDIESKGYTIVGCVGDQWSDITGPACGLGTFKIPNPFYFIP